ncbi:Hypothetical protein NTJ_08846 [Nesidiocoris tenuis]|uniref:Uncharacterized protein n=1 Tax=Nesidiocoris tenuis TaxID=355587 RepID=A0ABN7AV34_9HEMI|nr:Hypothetical protein NTJ_08846 [Nesidiocoris tenuis]
MAEMLAQTLLIEFLLFLIGTPYGTATELLNDEDATIGADNFIPSQFPSPPISPDGAEYVDYVIPIVRRNDFFLKAAKSVPRIGRRNDFFYAKLHKSMPRIGG